MSTPSAAPIETLLNEGNILLINKDYEGAEIRFSSVILALEHEQQQQQEQQDDDANGISDSDKQVALFRAYSHRSAARIHMTNKWAEVLSDANSATRITELMMEEGQHEESKNKNDELLTGEKAMAFGRAGVALYELQEYREAKDAFVQARKCSPNCGMADWLNWITKCEDQLLGTGGSTSVKSTSAANDATSVSAAKVAPASASTTTAKATKTIANTAIPVSIPKKPSKPTCPKYQYYQNENFMTISILEHNVEQKDLTVNFSLDKLTVLLQKGTEEFTVICGTLFDAVVVSKCKIKIMDEKVLIKLKKKNKFEWHELFGSGAKDDDKKDEGVTTSTAAATTTDATATTAATSAVPTIDSNQKPNRPYASHRDWDAIERNLKEEEENEKPVGDEALNKLFKDIYGKADRDTQRAMMKSYQTSGGTVLSTNWKDVEKTDYEKEKQAPKGMEWKNWEGDKLPQKDS